MGFLRDDSWKKAMAQWRSSISTYRSLLFTAVSLFSLAAMTWAGWNEGLAAYNQGDYTTAYREFLALAEQGNSEAQIRLASMYSLGRGVPMDHTKAANWTRKAADRGHGLGQYALGHMYYEGKGLPQDYVQVYMWFNLAASRLPPGDDQETAAKDRDMVAQKMTPAQIAEAQRLARQWKPK